MDYNLFNCSSIQVKAFGSHFQKRPGMGVDQSLHSVPNGRSISCQRVKSIELYLIHSYNLIPVHHWLIVPILKHFWNHKMEPTPKVTDLFDNRTLSYDTNTDFCRNSNQILINIFHLVERNNLIRDCNADFLCRNSLERGFPPLEFFFLLFYLLLILLQEKI